MEESYVEEDGIPKLTMSNFNSEFKMAFMKHCLKQGPAATALIRLITGFVPRDEDGDEIPLPPIPKMPEEPSANANADTKREYRAAATKYEEYIESKSRIMSKLLTKQSKEVASRVESNAGFLQALATYDLEMMWRITKAVALGDGAVSIYQLIMRLVKMREGEDLAAFNKGFDDAVNELLAQDDDPMIILKAIFNVLYVIGLNKAKYPDQIKEIYGKTQWPDYKVLSQELFNYSENQRLVESSGLKDDTVVQTSAMQVTYRKCWNCDSPKHFAQDCPKPPETCDVCGFEGHMGKHCPSRRQGTKEKPKRSEGTKEGTKRPEKGDKREKDRRPTSNASNSKPRSGAKQSSKSRRNEKTVKKAQAHVARHDSDDDYESEGEYDSDDYSSDETGSRVRVNVARITVNVAANKGRTKKSKRAEDRGDQVIFDTGCNGAHVFLKEAETAVKDLTPSQTEVSGIGGNVVAEKTGRLGKFGKTLIMPEGSESSFPTNILSERQCTERRV
jgi:hypothetical protein